MRNIRVARRYARSLLEASIVESALEPVKESVDLFHRSFATSGHLRALLRNPVVTAERKEVILNAIFGQCVHPLFREFLRLVCRKGRESMLDQIVEQFFILYNERNQIVVATVLTATPVSDDLQRRIETFVGRRFNGIPHLHWQADPAILGGLVIQCGDMRLDASIAGQLERLRKQLLATNVRYL